MEVTYTIGTLSMRDNQEIAVELTAYLRSLGCRSALRIAPIDLPGPMAGALAHYHSGSDLVTVDARLIYASVYGDVLKVIRLAVAHEAAHAALGRLAIWVQHGPLFLITCYVIAWRARLPFPDWRRVDSWPFSVCPEIHAYLADVLTSRNAHRAAREKIQPGYVWRTFAPAPRVSFLHRIFAALRAFIERRIRGIN